MSLLFLSAPIKMGLDIGVVNIVNKQFAMVEQQSITMGTLIAWTSLI